MARYIDVEDDIKVADYECGEFRGMFGRIKERLEAIQTADVVEVVRCKECEHSSWDELGKCYWCKGKERTADWFCADGERREDG